jgi:hypothetical protein
MLRLPIALLLMIFAGFAIGPSAFALDPIGSATVTRLSSCPEGGLPNGACYEVTISNCAETAGDFIATVKVNEPVNGRDSQGAVFFTTGGGGNYYYDNDASFITGDRRCNPQGNCGQYAVQALNDANYETIQTNFSDPNNSGSELTGWLTGPSRDGPRTLACRYATLVHAVWTDILDRDTSRPVCATGNSAGSSALAYSLTQYGLGSTFGPGPLISMAEASSGPPMGRMDNGCMRTPPSIEVTCPNGTVLSEGYGVLTALQFIDSAYDGDQDSTPDGLDSCADAIERGGGDSALFHYDSVVSTDYPAPNYPRTLVNLVFGDQDLSSAVPLGLEWYHAIASQRAQACVVGAQHELPGSYEGASQVANDLTDFCRLQRPH